MLHDRWFVLVILVVARTAMGFQFQTVGSLGPILVDMLQIDYASLGTLIGLFMLPGVVIALPGGVLGQRLGAKHVVVGGLALMAIGGALSASPSFGLVAAGRIVSGAGAILMNVMVTKMVTDWFFGREIVTAMSILLASWPLGIGLGQIVFVPVASAAGWGGAMELSAAVAFCCAALIAVVYRDPPHLASERSATLTVKLGRRELTLVTIAGLMWGAYNIAYVAFISFTPELLTTRGYSLSLASWIVSLTSWCLIATVPLTGYLADRAKRPNLLMTVGCLITALVVAALVATDSGVSGTIACVIAIAIAAAVPAGLIMALPAEVLPPEGRAAGMGVFYTWFYCAMAVFAGIAGMVRDLSGHPAAPVLFAGAMMTVALAFLAVFRLVQRRSFPRPTSESRNAARRTQRDVVVPARAQSSSPAATGK